MPRATCRCGENLNVPDDGTERVVCPSCGAKVRLRRAGAAAAAAAPGSAGADDFVRFDCPCGRRLKVNVAAGPRPKHGKCPDCGRVVPVPESAPAAPRRDPEAPTEELSPADLATLEAWSKRHVADDANGLSQTTVLPTHPARVEAGMRLCPACGKPVHMGATTCRACGIPVPKR